MSISASSSASAIANTIRSQFQSQFAKLKQAFEETGTVEGTQAAYQSDDGNLQINVRGFKTKDGQQAVDVTYKIKGAEGVTLQTAQGYGIKYDTGLALAADEQVGGEAMMSASDFVDDAGDFDALAQKFADLNLQTQDEANANVKSWTVGDKTFTDLQDYRAYMRVEYAASRLANEMALKMKFRSGDDEVNFVVSTTKKLADAMRQGGPIDLSSILEGVPKEALQAATNTAARDTDTQKLVKLLKDYIDANKEELANRKSDELFQSPRRNVLA
ncbi:MAG TPA: hypothetical protein VG742_20820 [Dongiaceae bacterium]|nr:hypothetical protein [Dongiaceae bacterium]